MSKVIKIKRGLDIRLKGAPEPTVTIPATPALVAVKPTDFRGIEPRLLVKQGQEVLTGTPLFCDKVNPDIVWVSPVCGIIEDVVRGERRKLLNIVVRAGSDHRYEHLEAGSPESMDPEKIRKQILRSGLWPSIIQRPYGVVARPGDIPRDIFISAFDSAPLGPDYGFILREEAEAFATGIAALKKLTSGRIHIGLDKCSAQSNLFTGHQDVDYQVFTGPHPAGNVGVQLHQVAPLNKGEVVWTVSPQLVALIGKTFMLGYLDSSWTFALCGALIREPRYIRGIMGMSVAALLTGQIVEEERQPRVISGNVLTGSNIGKNGYLGYYDSQVTVIPEGRYYDLLGWAMPGMKKYSASRTFLSSLFPSKSWNIDTNMKGGQRAFVLTGQYEKVFPMDIYPVQLLKAILVGDIDRMEQLGIYEVVEEDMALCEFVCTSKTEVQEILRNGLDLMRKEMGE
ncbi:MAG: Na(+)-translocating NADH-quinone reductase subunit A [Bacteroidales bacterium]|nr:Na(+)-translocating NADH-quinone reductase subunit A [Bacteroidales bacterium]